MEFPNLEFSRLRFPWKLPDMFMYPKQHTSKIHQHHNVQIVNIILHQTALPINISEKRHSNYPWKLWRGHGQTSLLFCNWTAPDWIKIRLDYSGRLPKKLVGCERRHSIVYSTAAEIGFTRIHNNWDTTSCNSRATYHCQLGEMSRVFTIS